MVRLWALERVWSSVRTSGTSVERIDQTSGVKPVDRTRELLPLLALCVYLMAIVKAGWLADDAFASFRAAANLVNGHGLLSNPPERVQAFTSPLWTLLFALLYWPAKNAYAVAISLALVCSIAAAALIAFSRRVDALSRALAVLALCLSMAFVDFSTSGLENPLAHLLLVAIYVCERRDRGTLVVALLSALLAVNRLDHLLLVAPLLAARLVRAALLGRARFASELKSLAIGFVPLIAWELFAIVYYGFPFPNTAYTKLNTTIGAGELFMQGLWYFVESATRDPLTPLLILVAIVVPFVTRNWRLLPVALGIALYLAYVLRIGGDFMLGRFFSAPFVLAVVMLFHDVVPALPARLALAAGAVVALVPLLSQSSRLTDAVVPFCPIFESGVSDERNCYREHTGLVSNVRIAKYKKHEYYERGVNHRKKGDGVIAEYVVGLAGFAAGPKVHLIDFHALTDPLLSRIPFTPPNRSWRIGHFYRTLPDGYLDTVRSGKNLIKDPCLARFYTRLHNVTSGPIFSWARVKDAFWLNFREPTTAACTK